MCLLPPWPARFSREPRRPDFRMRLFRWCRCQSVEHSSINAVRQQRAWNNHIHAELVSIHLTFERHSSTLASLCVCVFVSYVGCVCALVNDERKFGPKISDADIRLCTGYKLRCKSTQQRTPTRAAWIWNGFFFIAKFRNAKIYHFSLVRAV